MALRHFLDIDALDGAELRHIIDVAHAMKKAGGRRVPKRLRPKNIDGTVLIMIFEKPSTRTRVSFDVAMRRLGGESIVLNKDDLQLGRGESLPDTARVLSRYGDAIMIRANAHATLMELAEHATIPLINGLTEKSHPCQVMADIMTFEETHGAIEGKTIAWVGDGNNVAASWLHAAVRLGFCLRIACPARLRPDKELLAWATAEGGDFVVSSEPAAAVDGADCVVTDTWVSMGQNDADKRVRQLRQFRVDEKLMARASPDAIFMHCLPAYRGREVTTGVIDGPQSVVFDEAENRLHAQQAILAWCLEAS